MNSIFLSVCALMYLLAVIQSKCLQCAFRSEFSSSVLEALTFEPYLHKRRIIRQGCAERPNVHPAHDERVGGGVHNL